MVTLGGFLKEKRLELGLSYSKLGKKIGVSAMYLCDLENGNRIPLKGIVVEKIANFFNVPIDQLKQMALIAKAENELKKQDSDEINELKFALARRLFEKKDVEELFNSIY